LLGLSRSLRPSPPPDAPAQVDRIFARFNNTIGPGCAVGATIAGSPVLHAGYGMADLEHNVPIAPESIFEAGSVSKQFTARAVLLLAKQGMLSLDDPVRKYIPGLPDYGTTLTIRHMINHTSAPNTHAHVLEIISHQRAFNYPARR
jgi:CubicO group peptidase (beta-lactamase class C family)